MPMDYLIKKTSNAPALQGRWDEPAWREIPVLTLAHFLPRSSAHHPPVEVKLTYTDAALFVFFRVQDRYVRCVHTNYQDPVCQDSCVEFFVQPKAGLGYFNFETNCGGALWLSYVTDPTRDPVLGLKGWTRCPPEQGRQVRIYHSLPAVVEPEIQEPVEWRIEYCIPFGLLESRVGALRPVAGQTWRANFYKCGDRTSHPHWLAWAPLGPELNFHLPQYFAPIRFEK